MAKDKRDITTSPRIVELKRMRKKRNRFFFIIFFVLFIGLVIGLSYLSNYKKVVISNIVVEGTHIIDSNEVRNQIQKDLSGKYLYLFSKNNVFIYPKFFIEKNLKSTFPRIDDLSIRLDGLNTLKVNIGERTGSYMYCGGSMPTDSILKGDNCYFINNDGYIFDVAPYFSGNIYFKFYAPLTNSENPLGQSVLEKENFRQIIAFYDGLLEMGLHPVSVSFEDEERYTFHLLQRPDGVEPEVLFKKENDTKTIFDNLALAMKKEEFRNQIISKYSTLSYIDLRFDNKVLYKFQ